MSLLSLFKEKQETVQFNEFRMVLNGVDYITANGHQYLVIKNLMKRIGYL